MGADLHKTIVSETTSLTESRRGRQPGAEGSLASPHWRGRKQSNREIFLRKRLLIYDLERSGEGAERPRAPLARAVAYFMGYRVSGGGSGATASALGASGCLF